MLLRFKNLTVPGAVAGIQLKLKEWTQQGGSDYLFASKISRQDWDTNTATWKQYKSGSPWTTPGGDSGPAVAQFSAPKSGWVTIDLGTSFTIPELQQNGILITTNIPNWDAVWFFSNETTNPADRPALVITYLTPAAGSAAPAQQSPAMADAPRQFTHLRAIACDRGMVQAGSAVTCEVRLTDVPPNRSVDVSLTSSSPSLKVPAKITVSAGRRARFRAYLEPETPGGIAGITAQDGEHSATEYLNVVAGGAATLASADDTTESNSPVLSELRNGAAPGARAACSPGATASLIGAGLSPNAQVYLNGTSARVLRESDERLDFLCPAALAGALEIEVQTERGRSNVLKSTMASTAPGLFVAWGIPGQSQATAFVTSRLLYAALPTFWYDGTPALAGGTLTILGTGVNAAGIRPRVLIGDQYVPVESIDCSQDTGECEISVQLPMSISGDAVPVVLEGTDPDGRAVESNRVFVAIEGR
jgi:uncharacterized protein (TIGR03437 family)